MFTAEEERLKLLLSNCAYWAMNALGVKGSLEHIEEIQAVSLSNILSVSKEFAVHVPDTDSAVKFGGISATLIPEEGWPEPEKKWMQ